MPVLVLKGSRSAFPGLYRVCDEEREGETVAFLISGDHESDRKKMLALVLMCVVFASGVVVGIVGTQIYFAKRFSQPGSLAEAAIDISKRRLTRALDLRQDQQQSLDAILEGTRRELDTLRRDTAHRLRDIRDRSAAEFIEVLDEEQRQELEKIQAEQGRVFDEYLE